MQRVYRWLGFLAFGYWFVIIRGRCFQPPANKKYYIAYFII